MSLEALLEPVPDRQRGKNLCKVGNFISNLPEDIKLQVSVNLQKLYTDGGLTDEEWADRFKRAECSVSATVINRHRKGACCCA